MLSMLEGVGRFGHFAARTCWALPAALARPRELSQQLYHILIGALPLAVVGVPALLAFFYFLFKGGVL